MFINPTLTRNQRWLLSLLLLAAMTLFFSASQAQSIPAWTPNTAYTVNAKATYQGNVYQCRQAHTSIVTWKPINTPAHRPALVVATLKCNGFVFSRGVRSTLHSLPATR
jgi:hypothetical protein